MMICWKRKSTSQCLSNKNEKKWVLAKIKTCNMFQMLNSYFYMRDTQTMVSYGFIALSTVRMLYNLKADWIDVLLVVPSFHIILDRAKLASELNSLCENLEMNLVEIDHCSKPKYE